MFSIGSSRSHILSGTLKCVFLIFSDLFGQQSTFLPYFLGKRGPPCENIDRDLHFAPVVGPFWSRRKILKNRDLESSEIPNIDEVDRIYMASPRGLSVGKTEPPDYILMFYSANVPAIPYKINFEDFCPPFLKKIFESSTKQKYRNLEETRSGKSEPPDYILMFFFFRWCPRYSI